MANSLKELYLGLQSSPILTEPQFGRKVSVLYGGANIITTDSVLPRIVIVPRSGRYLPSTGYNNQPTPQNRRNISGVKESVEIWLWAVSDLPNPLPPDNDDAIEDLRMRVCQAMANQRWAGLYWVPQSEQWTSVETYLKYGSGLVITIETELTIPDVAPLTVRILDTEIENIIIPT